MIFFASGSEHSLLTYQQIISDLIVTIWAVIIQNAFLMFQLVLEVIQLGQYGVLLQYYKRATS